MNSDVWSLGLTLVAVAEGRYPLEGGGGYWDLLHNPSRILDGYEHYEGPILFTKDNRPLTFPQTDVLRQVWNAKK